MCLSYTNLIVKDGIKELNYAIKYIRNVVVFIHSSSSRLSKFREYAVLAKFSCMSKVPMDVKMRWNSTYKMLDVALKYRGVFERMVGEWIPFMRYFDEKDDKGKQRMRPPLKEDWDNAKAFVHFLKNFYDVTLELSASKTPTSQMISVSMFALQIEIEKKCDDSDPIMSEVAKAMKVKFDKYWGDWNKMNPVIFIANVLDPRNKLKMLQVSVKKLKRFGDSNQEVRELCDRFKNDLVTLWAEYKGVSDTLVTQKPLLENSGDGDDTGLGGSGLFDELYNGVQEEVSQDQLNQISNEVDKYLADEMEKRSNPYFDLL
ncbi:zinc finger BED domain-containing protein RICESLEEPER 2-like [Salvia splendens]|uniref:zinc finger BED domain-containing protein RICESLEEPER 2-like n=1 Tax=Salvia splendens TaxID=180675 RepID=UPI001C25E756|nr:zinc finger BED domain-containing protein RICESLEEPER 2-like [Salvia splendens]XP_042010982.1 zinc finger BED domain-containing protein RICESLEEPER 2-like [Salvia splendens]XP_042010983.1 zinc finger BED domain-containing protein RICESLEEPER 2-like [Salvia splendens]